MSLSNPQQSMETSATTRSISDSAKETKLLAISFGKNPSKSNQQVKEQGMDVDINELTDNLADMLILGSNYFLQYGCLIPIEEVYVL